MLPYLFTSELRLLSPGGDIHSNYIHIYADRIDYSVSGSRSFLILDTRLDPDRNQYSEWLETSPRGSLGKICKGNARLLYLGGKKKSYNAFVRASMRLELNKR